jgi:hypothetical protein
MFLHNARCIFKNNSMYYIWDSPQFTWDGAQMQPKAEQLHRIDPAKLGERRDPVFPNADPYLLSTTSCSCGRKGRETDLKCLEIRWLTSRCSNTLCGGRRLGVSKKHESCVRKRTRGTTASPSGAVDFNWSIVTLEENHER